MHRDRAHPLVVLLTVVALVVGCGSAASSPRPDGHTAQPTTMPSASAAAALPTPSAASATPPAEPPTPVATPTPTPTLPPPDPLAGKAVVGTVVVTVSDNLVVRSDPRVSADSTMLKPWLPLGTELLVLGGPEVGSGYAWYMVAPVSFTGLDNSGYGWVAAAGKDGEPWIGLPTTTAAEPPGVEFARADIARAKANPKDAKTAAASITAFGLDLYRAILVDPELSLAEKNVVFSPTSIALAISMARAGAKGETASQMDAALHTSGWDALGPGLNALDQALASRDGPWQSGERVGQLALRIANTAFGQQGWKIEQPYLERIAATFGSGLRLLDYKADPEAARKTINAWVSDQTKRRIPELIPKVTPPLIDKMTRLVLVNAIYLKATWENEFAKSDTEPARFTRLDDSRVDVPTMHAEFYGDTPYATGTGWRATELRYIGPGGAPLAMTLVLPDDLAAFEKSLSPSMLTRITGAIAGQRDLLARANDCEDVPKKGYALDLFMPRFGVETWASLKTLLKALGMPLAFTGGVADFSGIHVPESYAEILYISEVIHQANIDVDEEGTVAAAATAVIMGATGGGCSPVIGKTITLRLDHPFLFFVRDLETGAVLFMGRVVDPSATKGS